MISIFSKVQISLDVRRWYISITKSYSLQQTEYALFITCQKTKLCFTLNECCHKHFSLHLIDFSPSFKILKHIVPKKRERFQTNMSLGHHLSFFILDVYRRTIVHINFFFYITIKLFFSFLIDYHLLILLPLLIYRIRYKRIVNLTSKTIEFT